MLSGKENIFHPIHSWLCLYFLWLWPWMYLDLFLPSYFCVLFLQWLFFVLFFCPPPPLLSSCLLLNWLFSSFKWRNLSLGISNKTNFQGEENPEIEKRKLKLGHREIWILISEKLYIFDSGIYDTKCPFKVFIWYSWCWLPQSKWEFSVLQL